MNKKHLFIIKVACADGSWQNNAFTETCFSAVQVSRFYRDQLGYNVQLWHDEQDVTFLIDKPLGPELSPGEPDNCNGNGRHGIECQCDECDYLMLCEEQLQMSCK